MNPTVRVTCRRCRHTNEFSVQRYFSSVIDPELSAKLLRGEIGVARCLSCDFVGIVSMPMIFSDPGLKLLVFVCDGDRETLIEEFHDLLESCRPTIPKEDYENTLARNFQVVVGYNELVRIVTALKNGVPCLRIVPGLSEQCQFDTTVFLKSAKYFRLAGRHKQAFAIVKAASAFPSTDPSLFWELGAYAFSAGALEEAERAIVLSIEYRTKRCHMWEQLVISEGALAKIREEVALPKLAAKMRPIYDGLRPERHLDEAQLAGIGGTLSGIYAYAVAFLEPAFNLSLFRHTIQFQKERLFKAAKVVPQEKLAALWADAEQSSFAMLAEEAKKDINCISDATYDDGTASVVIATFFVGLEHFRGVEYQQTLAEVFCHAIRDAILEGLTCEFPNCRNVLVRVAGRLEASPAKLAAKAFSKLSPDEFEKAYRDVLLLAGREHVQLITLADALKHSRKLGMGHLERSVIQGERIFALK